MIFRWLAHSEIESLVNPVLELKGWAKLNINEASPTCRVLGAFLETGELIESFTFQLFPVLGPMVRHDNTIRDSGETSRQLAAIMYNFLSESGARDFLAIANSPVTARLCERFGMKKTECQVYLNHPGEAFEQ